MSYRARILTRMAAIENTRNYDSIDTKISKIRQILRIIVKMIESAQYWSVLADFGADRIVILRTFDRCDSRQNPSPVAQYSTIFHARTLSCS